MRKSVYPNFTSARGAEGVYEVKIVEEIDHAILIEIRCEEVLAESVNEIKVIEEIDCAILIEIRRTQRSDNRDSCSHITVLGALVENGRTYLGHRWRESDNCVSALRIRRGYICDRADSGASTTSGRCSEVERVASRCVYQCECVGQACGKRQSLTGRAIDDKHASVVGDAKLSWAGIALA